MTVPFPVAYERSVLTFFLNV